MRFSGSRAIKTVAFGNNQILSKAVMCQRSGRNLQSYVFLESSDPGSFFMDELHPIQEVTFGAIAGLVGKVVEHPFDTVKVRVQTLNQPTMRVIHDTFVREGIVNGFYRGIKAPLVGASLENAILFSSYRLGEAVLDRYVVKRQSVKEEMPFWSKMVAGGYAGFMALFVLTPVELIKCQLQVLNLTGKHETYKSLIRRIIASNGITGLWHGLSSTVTREVIGTSIWFGSYEYCNQRLEAPLGSLTLSLLSGAVAGAIFNALVFPVDTIKLNIQTYEVLHNKRVGIGFIVSKLAQQGITTFYKGLGITLVRAIPANALIFYTYESLLRLFGPPSLHASTVDI